MVEIMVVISCRKGIGHKDTVKSIMIGTKTIEKFITSTAKILYTFPSKVVTMNMSSGIGMQEGD